jgi:hypothetical protein
MSQHIRKQEVLGDTILKLIKLHSNIIETYEQANVFNIEDEKLLTRFKNEHIVFLQELNRIFKKYQVCSVVENNTKIKPINCVTRSTGKALEKKQVPLNLIEEELNKYCF